MYTLRLKAEGLKILIMHYLRPVDYWSNQHYNDFVITHNYYNVYSTCDNLRSCITALCSATQ